MVKNYSLHTAFVCFIIIALGLSSCVKNDDETYVPSYVSVKGIDLETTSVQGSSDSYFTDVWVTLDSRDRGMYELPSRVPLLADAKHKMTFTPGIKLNGIAATRVPYLMVQPIEMELDLAKDKVLHLETLTAKYYDDVKFVLLEDFEDVNTTIDTTKNNTALWAKSSVAADGEASVFEGLHSGMATLDTAHRRMQLVTKENFTELPQQGHPVFVELNFKTEETVVFSVNAYTNGVSKTTDLLFLNPTNKWKKIYINLTATLGYATSAESFKFVLTANYSGADNSSAKVLIDNYKILYRSTNK